MYFFPRSSLLTLAFAAILTNRTACRVNRVSAGFCDAWRNLRTRRLFCGSHLLEDHVGRIVAGRAGHLAARMRAGAAQI